jgi:hypothetical protein
MENNRYFTQVIAMVAPDLEHDEKWRVTLYCPNGPHNHHVDDRSQIFGEVRGYIPSIVAPRLLDHWSTKPEWKTGIKLLEKNKEDQCSVY